jgi:hypothetical protein
VPDSPAALFEEDLRRIRDLAQTRLPHLEDADLVGRPEAVLRRAEDAEGMESLAFEIEHGVDDVLEHAWARDGALLRDVTDQEDRHVVAFRDLEEARGAFAQLRDAPGG